MEKEMATHSSTLAWKIPWMEEHYRLQSIGLQRLRDFTFTIKYKCIWDVHFTTTFNVGALYLKLCWYCMIINVAIFNF